MRFSYPLSAAIGAILACVLVTSCSRQPVETASAPASRANRPVAPLVFASELEQRLASPATAERLGDDPALARQLAAAQPARLARAFRDFADWLSRYENASPDERAALLESGRERARERRTALKSLIALDPELALQLSLPAELRAGLPTEISELLETPLATTGSYVVDISCGLPADAHDHSVAHDHQITRTFRADGEAYRTFVYGERLGLVSKADLPVFGIAIDDMLAIADTGIRRLSPEGATPITYAIGGEQRQAASEAEFAAIIAAQTEWEQSLQPTLTAESPWTEGAKKMLYIRATFSDSPDSEPISLASAQSNQAVVDTFYRDNSYNKTSIATTVTPVAVVLPNAEAYYNGQSWLVLLADARAAAKELGEDYDYANYDLYTIATKKMSSMTWAGRASIGAAKLQESDAAPLGYSHLNGDYALRVTAHEFGHNFGLYHANYSYTLAENPLNRVAYPSAPENSPTQEYGHRYNMMGSSGATTAFHFSAREKQLLDWLPIEDSPLVLQSGIFRLYRHDHREASSQIRSLRIPGGDATRSYFWLSYRAHPYPQTYANNFSTGAEVLWGRHNSGSGGTLLLDMTPFSNDGPHSDSASADNNDKRDAALTEGRMFGNPDSGAWFTVIGRGGVEPGEYLDVAVNIGNFSRNRPPVVTLDQTTATLALNEPLTLTASATNPDGDAVYYSWEFGDDSVGGNQAEQTKSWSSTGHYVVRVTAVDGKGGYASARCVVRVGSPSTFTATGRVLANGQPVEGVRVFNGLTGANYRGTRTDSEGYFTLPNLTLGSYTLQARKDGYTFVPVFTNPVSISGHATELDFTATTAPGVEIIVDNSDETGVEIVGSWNSISPQTSSTSAQGFYAHDYITDNNGGKGQRQVTFRPELPSDGLYRVYMRYAQGSARANNVPVDIGHEAGVTTLTIDQRANGGTWYYLGTYSFAAGTSGFARVRNTGTSGSVSADAFKFELTNINEPTVRLQTVQPNARERGLVPAILRIEREGPLDFPLTVHLGTSSIGEGVATPDVDFTPLPDSVTIPAGADFYELALSPLADSIPEGDETVTVSLRQPPEPTQEWEFNDASGTALPATRNSVEGGGSWSDAIDSTTTTGGVLRIKRDPDNGGPTNSYVMLPNPNPTKIQHLVLETAGWTYAGTSPNEVVRFGFTTGANTTVTAQALISRTASGITLAGDALGDGATPIAPVQITTSINTTEPYTFVLSVDHVAKTYRIQYRQGASGAFVTIGTGTISPTRALAAIRFGVTNSFASSTSEKFDVARIALTEADPTQPAYVIAAPSTVEITIKDDPRDDWRFRHFSTEQIANGVLTAWDADPDNDGLSNLHEYAFNRAPLVADAAALTAPATLALDGKTYLSLTFDRRADDDGLSYFVEATSDLISASWPDSAVLHGEPVPSDDAGYEQVTFRDTVSLDDAARRFLRVRIELEP